MIGGGGKSCSRADHGIGTTEENYPVLGGTLDRFDFGEDSTGTQAYALNLWVL